MQVLTIIGSPRKGHSYRVAQQIERRLTQNPDVRFEYVFLNQLNLQTCRGCSMYANPEGNNAVLSKTSGQIWCIRCNRRMV